MTKSSKQYWHSIIAALVLVLGLLLPTTTQQAQSLNKLGIPLPSAERETGAAPADDDHNNFSVFPPDSRPFGHSSGHWAEQWWQWALSIPAAENPVLDTTGDFCDEGQRGHVWFLAGTFFNGSVERSCTIPANKAIFIPVHNWIFGSGVFDCDPTNPGVPCVVTTLRAAAAAAATSAEVLEASIDGVPVNNVRAYRAFSPGPFSITLPVGAVFGIPAGTYFPQVADGYWLLLAPLHAGRHTIRVHAVNSNTINGPINTTVTYYLTVRSGPRDDDR